MLLAFLLTLDSCNNSKANSENVVIAYPASSVSSYTSNNIYSWKDNYDSKNAIINRITYPEGYKRVEGDLKKTEQTFSKNQLMRW